MVVAAIVGWSLVAGDGADESAEAEAAQPAEAEAAQPAEASTTERTTTTPPTNAASVAPPAMDAPTVTVIGDGSPLLGEPTGFRLVIGQTSGGPTVLDLDSGELIRAPRQTRGFDPMMISGRWMVGQRADQLMALSTDDLAAPPVALESPSDLGWTQVIDLTPRPDGLAWLFRFEAASQLVLTDLATGTAVDSAVDTALGRVFDPFGGPNVASFGSGSSPPIVDSRAGGIYELGDGGFRQVAVGQVMAANDRQALVESCDTAMSCRRRWLDRTTWEPLDLALPPDDADSIDFVGGSDWLLVARYSANASIELFDVTTGRTRDLESNYYDGFNGRTPAVSDDGRWLAQEGGGALMIVDLDSGEERTFAEVPVSFAPRMLFTSSAVGYATPAVEVDE